MLILCFIAQPSGGSSQLMLAGPAAGLLWGRSRQCVESHVVDCVAHCLGPAKRALELEAQAFGYGATSRVLHCGADLDATQTAIVAQVLDDGV